MVLPQGQFSAFLKAKESERAQILSTITHTEDYERIGSKDMMTAVQALASLVD